MTNAERRELLTRFRTSGMEGSILDVFAAAKEGRDLIAEHRMQQEREQPLVATTPEEQKDGLRPYHQAGETDRSMIFKDVPPNTPFNTVGMKRPINIEKRDPETGHLIESHKSVPPGIKNVPTGPYRGDVIETPAEGYRDGGVVKKQSGGPRDINVQQSPIGFGMYPNVPEGYKLNNNNDLVPQDWSEYHDEGPTPQDIDLQKLKMGLRFVESSDGANMINPESSATGFYGQRFSEIDGSRGFTHDLVKDGMTRAQFASDTTLQNKIFEERVFHGLGKEKSTQTNVDDIFTEYESQLGDKWNYSGNDIAALVNLLGREGTRRYLGYVVRDGKSLEEVFPKKYGPKATQKNKTPQEYLDIVREHSVRQKGGLVRKMQKGGSYTPKSQEDYDYRTRMYNDSLTLSKATQKQIELMGELYSWDPEELDPMKPMGALNDSRWDIREKPYVGGNVTPLDERKAFKSVEEARKSQYWTRQDEELYDYYVNKLKIPKDRIGIYSSADVFATDIKPTHTFYDGRALSPYYEAPKQKIKKYIPPPPPPPPAPDKIERRGPRPLDIDPPPKDIIPPKGIIIPPKPEEEEVDPTTLEDRRKPRKKAKRFGRGTMYRRTLSGRLVPKKRKFKKQGK